jgi:hypothetical protein
MPLNKLILKVGAPIMLLRNLDIKNGLSNGTRLIVTNIGKRVLEADKNCFPQKYIIFNNIKNNFLRKIIYF